MPPETDCASPDGPLEVRSTACINVRGRQMLCRRCVDACPADAIDLSIDTLRIDPARCTGCGACVPVCRAAALALDGFAPLSLLDAASGKDRLDVTCDVAAGPGTSLPCLAVLDARLLCGVAAQGAAHVVMHGANLCAMCRRGDARPVLRRLACDLAAWLGAAAPQIEEVPAPARRPAPRATKPDLKRRAFLKLGRAARRPRDHTDDGARPHPYQTALMRAMPVLAWRGGRRHPWHLRRVDARCNLCGICARKCPTGALRLEVTDTTRALTFDPALCTGCGLCIRLCPYRGIKAGVGAVAGGRRVLRVRREARCARCGQPEDAALLETRNGLCSPCHEEAALDAAMRDLFDPSGSPRSDGAG